MLVSSQFSVRPASLPRSCGHGIWLAITTVCGAFTYSAQKPAMLNLKASGRFHTSWQHKLAYIRLDKNSAIIYNSRNSATKWIWDVEQTIEKNFVSIFTGGEVVRGHASRGVISEPELSAVTRTDILTNKGTLTHIQRKIKKEEKKNRLMHARN